MLKIWCFVPAIMGTLMTAAPGSGQQSVAIRGSRTEADTLDRAVFARPVTLRLNHQTLRSAIDALASSAHVLINYREPLLDAVTTPVTLNVKRVPLGDVIEQILRGTGLQAIPRAVDQISITRDNGRQATLGVIIGTVREAESKQPLGGATVLLDDATRGATTADDGSFRIAGVTAGPHRVTARFIGHVRQVTTVTVADDSTVTANLFLGKTARALDQVVVTGTVVPTQLKAVPNAITVITAKQLEERGITKIDQLFRGDVPGVFAQNQGSYSGALLDEVTMFSRGATALSPNSVGVSQTTYNTNPIKTYVDGVELADPKYLSQIDPQSIERIEIITGPQASTIYGSNAINGVMQIFTKRGATPRPNFTLSVLNGWIENNFRPTRTPQHNYDTQLNGVEGKLSYNIGSSWDYMGPWTPSKQTARLSGFGGTRLDLPTPAGKVVVDLTLRRAKTQTLTRGDQSQVETRYKETGWWTLYSSPGLIQPRTSSLNGQTMGLMLQYMPARWLSQDLGISQDISDSQLLYTAPGYGDPSDSGLYFSQNHEDRRSAHSATTLQIPLTSLARATVTAGADAWQALSLQMSASGARKLTGGFRSSTYRVPSHNAGGYLQSQLGVADRLFLSYGLRVERNPDIGDKARVLPGTMGVAYTQEVGAITAKLRGSYGRSIRPPPRDFKNGKTVLQVGAASYVPEYGNYLFYLPSPELGPEYQQGGEAGIELYVGTRGSLMITRYNQTVNGLIESITADSVRSFNQNPVNWNWLSSDGYGYAGQYQWINLASIRNQGWELRGSTNLGPFTTHGTYSWTKSRVIGITEKYLRFFENRTDYSRLRKGASFQYLPEHTWAMGISYAYARTTIALDVNGTGQFMSHNNELYYRSLYSIIRLPNDRALWNVNNDDAYLKGVRGYALADFNMTQRLFPSLDVVLRAHNLMNRYTNDLDAQYASLGRQTTFGFTFRP